MTGEELTEVIGKHGDMMYRLAYSCTGDVSVCDDIVQEALIKYYRRGERIADAEGEKAWLIRVTVNICRNHTKSRWVKRRSELTGNEPAPCPADADELTDLRDAIRALKPIYREVIHLHYYEGYTAEQIARLLHLSTSAVTSRLKRGRERLKRCLEEEEK